MNPLEALIAQRNLCPAAVMNRLEGIVSDNCIWPADVAPCDCESAVLFLNGLSREEKRLLTRKPDSP